MKINYYQDPNPIKDFNDWDGVFSNHKSKDWKPCRSAYSLAEYMMQHDGFNQVIKMASNAIGDSITAIDTATIEDQVAFDAFYHKREHDLTIVAQTASKKSVFIGIEAKVDEPFGNDTVENYRTDSVIKNSNSKVPERISDLRKYVPQETSDADFGKLRYQLLTATAGTLCAKDNNNDYDYYIFMVLVFKTKSYDQDRGDENKKDFNSYIDAMQAVSKGDGVYKCVSNGKNLTIIYKEI